MATAEASTPDDSTTNPESDESASNIANLRELVASSFHNHVIVEHFMQYLDFASIKALSAVNKQLNWIVRGNKKFTDRCKVEFFTLGQGTIQVGPKPEYFKPSDFPWKTVAVNLDGRWEKKEVAAICRLIPNITTLELISGSPSSADLIATLLRTTTNLRELTLDADILDLIPSKSFDVAVKNAEGTLTTLDSLYIKNPISVVVGETSFGANIKLLGETPTALSRFRFERIFYTQDVFDLHRHIGKEAITEPLISVLQNHHKSLTCLAIGSSIWDSDTSTSLVFPRLTDLSLVGNQNEFTKLAMFLSKQPPLQGLNLKLDGVTHCHQHLGPPLLKHAPHLKKFNFSWTPSATPLQQLHQAVVRNDCDDEEDLDNNAEVRQVDYEISGRVPPDAEVAGDDAQGPNNNAPLHAPRRIDFSFLKNFGALQKIKLRQCTSRILSRRFELWMEAGRDPRISLGTIFSLIPDGIREIDMGGIRPRLGESAQTTIESLSRFCNLTVLNLVQCPGAITNEILVYICSHMKSLLELGFSHCKVSDEALTGKRQDAIVSPGINALTGLRKLKIIHCFFLSRKALLSSLTFPDLRYLTLFQILGAQSQQFYETILKQNKSLEILEISDREEQRFPELEKVLKQCSGRFRCLYFIPPVRDTVDPRSDERDSSSDDTYSDSSDLDFYDEYSDSSDLDFYDGYSDVDDIYPEWEFGGF